MSRHVWESDPKRLSKETIKEGVAAYKYALARNAPPEEALTFAGYYLETMRQKPMDWKYGSPNYGKKVTPAILWAAAERSGHRYATGKNRDNYEKAGRLILPYLK